MPHRKRTLPLFLIALLILPVCVCACASPLAPRTPTPLPRPTVAVTLPKMVRVEPGSFIMGRDDGVASEGPAHPVTLTRAYEIAVHPVTYTEYDLYCGDQQIARVNPEVSERERPVSHVDWYDAVAYCNWLSEQAGLTPCYSGGGRVTACDFDADGYRLPTEAEWEFAARGGIAGRATIYAGSDDPDKVGWYAGNSGGHSHPVGELAPNALGLYDVSGNRWEWCWDWFDPDYYARSPEIDPLGPDKPIEGDWIERSRRSGSAQETKGAMRVTYRSADFVNYPGDNGFRLVRTLGR